MNLVRGAVLVGVALPLASTLVGLYDRIEHWGKFVHAVDGFCATFIIGLLLLAWRDYKSIDLTDELSAVLAMFSGIFFGVMWEIIEFIRDWVADSDLQKSNTDTMTDFLANDIATLAAALLAARLYCHAINPRERQELGRATAWLVNGPSRALDRHGWLLTGATFAAIAIAVALLWFADRPVPGLAIP